MTEPSGFVSPTVHTNDAPQMSLMDEPIVSMRSRTWRTAIFALSVGMLVFIALLLYLDDTHTSVVFQNHFVTASNHHLAQPTWLQRVGSLQRPSTLVDHLPALTQTFPHSRSQSTQVSHQLAGRDEFFSSQDVDKEGVSHTSQQQQVGPVERRARSLMRFLAIVGTGGLLLGIGFASTVIGLGAIPFAIMLVVMFGLQTFGHVLPFTVSPVFVKALALGTGCVALVITLLRMWQQLEKGYRDTQHLGRRHPRDEEFSSNAQLGSTKVPSTTGPSDEGLATTQDRLDEMQLNEQRAKIAHMFELPAEGEIGHPDTRKNLARVRDAAYAAAEGGRQAAQGGVRRVLSVLKGPLEWLEWQQFVLQEKRLSANKESLEHLYMLAVDPEAPLPPEPLHKRVFRPIHRMSNWVKRQILGPGPGREDLEMMQLLADEARLSQEKEVLQKNYQITLEEEEQLARNKALLQHIYQLSDEGEGKQAKEDKIGDPKRGPEEDNPQGK